MLNRHTVCIGRCRLRDRQSQYRRQLSCNGQQYGRSDGPIVVVSPALQWTALRGRRKQWFNGSAI